MCAVFTKQDANAESEGAAPMDLIRGGGSIAGHPGHPGSHCQQPLGALALGQPAVVLQPLQPGVAEGAVWGPYHQPYGLQSLQDLQDVATTVCVELIGK